MSETDAPRPTETGNEDDEINFSGEPLQWVIIPIIIVGLFLAFSAAALRYRRRNKRLPNSSDRQWPTTSGDTGGAFLGTIRRGSRAARAEEGLNELGEAPPPYDPKNDGRNENSPPAYDFPAQPPAAVTEGGNSSRPPSMRRPSSSSLGRFMMRPLSMGRPLSVSMARPSSMSRPTSMARPTGMSRPTSMARPMGSPMPTISSAQEPPDTRSPPSSTPPMTMSPMAQSPMPQSPHMGSNAKPIGMAK